MNRPQHFRVLSVSLLLLPPSCFPHRSLIWLGHWQMNFQTDLQLRGKRQRQAFPPINWPSSNSARFWPRPHDSTLLAGCTARRNSCHPLLPLVLWAQRGTQKNPDATRLPHLLKIIPVGIRRRRRVLSYSQQTCISAVGSDILCFPAPFPVSFRRIFPFLLLSFRFFQCNNEKWVGPTSRKWPSGGGVLVTRSRLLKKFLDAECGNEPFVPTAHPTEGHFAPTLNDISLFWGQLETMKSNVFRRLQFRTVWKVGRGRCNAET